MAKKKVVTPAKPEPPQTIHGRLMEAIHVSGYTFERACTELEWLLDEERWKLCGEGFDDINTFLKTVDLSPFNIESSNRKRLVKKIADLEASQRAIAGAVGVDETTVRRDLGTKDAANAANGKSTTLESKGEKPGNAANAASTISGSGQDAAKAVEKKGAHVGNNSGENEWYTPEKFLVAARKVLGKIDLDPASSPVAQENVKASRFFTIEDDGLTKKWSGRVFLNPPYAKDLIEKFSLKLAESCESGDISAAILLVNNATETQWFQQVSPVSECICFPKGRIQYLDKTGKPANTPLQGQAFLYFGKKPDKFIEVFSEFGFVARCK